MSKHRAHSRPGRGQQARSAVYTYPDALQNACDEALAHIAALRLSSRRTLKALHEAESVIECAGGVRVHGVRETRSLYVGRHVQSCERAYQDE